MHRAATLVQTGLWVVGAVCLGAWGTVTVLAHAANARNAAILERLIHEGRRGGAAGPALNPPGAEGTLLGRIDLPRVGVSTVILEGTSERVLEQAAGHISGTARPGENGNVALAGHRDSFFRGLRDVAPGDTILLTTPTQRRDYAVRSTRIVDPDDTAVLDPLPGSTLTLITCYPFRYVGAAPRRLVVEARQIGAPVPATTPLNLPTAGADEDESLHVVRRPSRSPHHPLTGGGARVRRDTGVPSAAPATTPTAPPHKLRWWQRLFRRRPSVAQTGPPSR